MEISEEIVKQLRELGVTREHATDMEYIDNYVKDHKLNELFNELLTNILHERPEDPRQHVIEQLKSLSKRDFKKEDPHNENIYEMAD